MHIATESLVWYNNLTCREVVRSPMVEAQCSVQLCFPVELKYENMVLLNLCSSSLCYSFFYQQGSNMLCHNISTCCVTPYKRSPSTDSVYFVDGGCSHDWTGEQAPGNEDTTSPSFQAWTSMVVK